MVAIRSKQAARDETDSLTFVMEMKFMSNVYLKLFIILPCPRCLCMLFNILGKSCCLFFYCLLFVIYSIKL